ncbi:MAG: DMT family transporter [Pseudomonadota bacterium]
MTTPTQPGTSARTDRISRGIAFVLISSVLLAPLVQASSKYLSYAFPVLQILWVRCVGHTAWMIVVFWRSHGLAMFHSNRPRMQFARSTLLAVCSLTWLMAIPDVPLASAGVIMFTTPMFVALLSAPMLSERVGRHRGAAIIAGFAGVLIVLRPWHHQVVWEMLLIVVAAFCYAVYQVLTRQVSAHDSAATSAVYAVAVGAVVVSLFMPFYYQLPAAGEWHYWLGFLLVGLVGGFRHLFMVKAFESAPASVVSPFCYTELIGITALGMLMFGELPDVWTGVGACVIVASGLYIARHETLAARRGAAR